MLKTKLQSTLDNEYLTIWITIELHLEPNIVIKLATLKDRYRTDQIINLYLQATQPHITSDEVAATLISLGLTQSSIAKANILLSLWKQLRLTQTQATQRPLASGSSSRSTQTTSS
jgi:hypothetical protein